MNLIEHIEAPSICTNCLDNTTTRLIKDSLGAECRICSKPFITYRWFDNNLQFHRSTVICPDCANKLGICQSCGLDLQYHILPRVRDTALRILDEEKGTEEDRATVLAAVARSEFGTQSSTQPKEQTHTKESELSQLIARFPLMGRPRPESCRTLCVYGVEKDLDAGAIRSFLNASISRMEYVAAAKYAFIEFSSEADLPKVPDETIIDGRRLVFAWGDRFAVPPTMHKAVKAVIRAYLRQTLN